MKKATDIMFIVILWLMVLCFSLMLLGCSRKTPVETAFDDVNQSIVTTKESLPVECKTEIVMAKFDELEAKEQVAQSTCELKIKEAQTKFERVLGVLILIILGFFAKFLLKK